MHPHIQWKTCFYFSGCSLPSHTENSVNLTFRSTANHHPKVV